MLFSKHSFKKLGFGLLISTFALLSPSFGQPSNQEEREQLNDTQKAELKSQEIQLRSLLLKNPQIAEAHLNLGNIYWKQGRDGKPIRHYLAAIKLNPNYAEAYYNLGNVFFEQGEREQAYEAYKKSTELKPNFALAFNGLGNSLLDDKKYNQAIENYKHAIQLDPNYKEAIYNLCTSYIYSAKYLEAVNACQRAANTTNDSRAWNNLGNAYFRTKQFDLALRAYNTALELDPELPEAHFNIAAISLVHTKNKEEALNREKILKVIDPQKSHKLSSLIKSSRI
ncbi:MAG: tetratricopeptide repeat protein [Candidatus Caenarcaniphilales bacterium]|nr:tetratricopeptide repeat protein [Candidatus Caenarcaniphilales bacterium]